MKTRILGASIVLANLAILVYFGFFIFTISSVEHAIKRNREIEAAFRDAAQFIDSYKFEHNSSLPSAQEFSHRPGIDRYQMSELITLNGCAEPLPEKFGTPEPNSYYLGYWRGEWCEFFVSWTAQTTLKFEKDDYVPLHSYAMTWMFFIFSIIGTISGVVLMTKKKQY